MRSRCSMRRIASSTFQALPCKLERRLASHPAVDGLLRGDHRAVAAAAEVAADLGQRRPRVLAGQPHRQHPRLATSSCRASPIAASPLPGRTPRTRPGRCRPAARPRVVADHFRQRLFGQRARERLRRIRAAASRRFNRSAQLAGMARQVRGHELGHVVGQRSSRGRPANCRTMPSRVWISGGSMPQTMPWESRVTSSSHDCVNSGGGAIGGEHELPALAQQRVGCVQQFDRAWPVCRRRIAAHRRSAVPRPDTCGESWASRCRAGLRENRW